MSAKRKKPSASTKRSKSRSSAGRTRGHRAESQAVKGSAPGGMTAEAQFRIASVARGDAAPADAEGRLPPGATHELKGYDEDGVPIIVRRRFSVS